MLRSLADEVGLWHDGSRVAWTWHALCTSVFSNLRTLKTNLQPLPQGWVGGLLIGSHSLVTNIHECMTGTRQQDEEESKIGFGSHFGSRISSFLLLPPPTHTCGLALEFLYCLTGFGSPAKLGAELKATTRCMLRSLTDEVGL